MTVKKTPWVALATALLLLWISYVYFAGVKPISLDEKMLTPWWQSVYSVRWIVSLLLLGVTCAYWWEGTRQSPDAVREKGWRRIVYSRGSYFLLVLLTMVLCRWYSLAGNEFDYDASQSIVNARTLLRDPRYWVSADGGTHGPGVPIPQMILPLCGISIDYAGSRLLGIALMFLCVCCVFGVIRRLSNEHTARMLLIPSVFIYCALRYGDLLEYNGEHPLILYIMLALYCLSSAFYSEWEAGRSFEEDKVPERHTLIMLLLAGLFLGIVPWTKVQGLPLTAASLVIGVLGCFLANRHNEDAYKARTVSLRLLLLGIGFAIPTAALLGWLVYTNSFSLMFDSYIGWNLAYAKRNKLSFLDKAWNLRRFVTTFLFWSSPYHVLLLPITVVALCVNIWKNRMKKRNARATVFMLASLFILLVSVITILAPGNEFYHYLLLSLFPFCLVYSILWLSLFADPVAGAFSKGAATFVVGGVILPLGIWGFVPSQFETERLVSLFSVVTSPHTQQGDTKEAREMLVHALSKIVVPGDYVAVWGYRPELFVRTNTLSATRSSANLREAIKELPLSDHFLRLFVQDLELKKPMIFVDNTHFWDNTVGNYIYIRQTDNSLPERTFADFRYENYPQLKEFVSRNYTLYATMKSGERIFIRKGFSPAAKFRRR